jgi:hypothetical protein
MTDPARVKLHFGPYTAPALKRGGRAYCLYRGCVVVVIGWSRGPLPWPRCRSLGARAGWGLLVDEELARAVRHESCAAVSHWWGVSRAAVRSWRRALGVTRTNNEGTRRLVLGAIEATLAARRCRTGVWSPREVALLGALPDAEVARATGRSLSAVNKKRASLGRPALAAGGEKPRRVFWTEAEDEAARTLPTREAARRTGRSLEAVRRRRQKLGGAARRG